MDPFAKKVIADIDSSVVVAPDRLLAEKSDSIFAKGAYDRKSVQMLILRYPFKTFEDRHSLIIVRRRQVNEY